LKESQHVQGKAGRLEIESALIVNAIRMKLMRMIYTTTNMPSQEFQHRVESQLIEGMKMKMHRIQFVLIVKLIRTRSSGIADSVQNISH
jgi:hypothetical protein